MTEKANIFEGETIVLTGTFATMKRSEAKKLLTDIGAKVSGSVSGKTNFLIHGENAGSKLSKAEKLGVTIMTEIEMVAELAGDDRVGDRLGDADAQIAEQQAASGEKMKPVNDIVDPIHAAQKEAWGMTLGGLLKCYFKVLEQRKDIVVTKNEWARPTPNPTLLKWAGNMAPHALALFSEIGPVEFIWILQTFADEKDGFSEGYRGGRINLVGLEKFQWWSRPEWGGHGEFDKEGTFDDLQAEGFTVLSYNEGEKPSDAALVFDDANDCERYSLGGIDGYLTEGAKAAFVWYWPRSGREADEFRDALLENSVAETTSATAAAKLLVGKGLTESEADAMCKWLGSDVRILLPS